MGIKVNASLGATICTDPENRNFLRVGVELQGIEIDGDVEAQGAAGMTATLTILKILNDGLEETIADVILDRNTQGSVKETLAVHEEKLNKFARLLHQSMQKIAALEAPPEPAVPAEEKAPEVKEPKKEKVKVGK